MASSDDDNLAASGTIPEAQDVGPVVVPPLWRIYTVDNGELPCEK